MPRGIANPVLSQGSQLMIIDVLFGIRVLPSRPDFNRGLTQVNPLKVGCTGIPIRVSMVIN